MDCHAFARSDGTGCHAVPDTASPKSRRYRNECDMTKKKVIKYK